MTKYAVSKTLVRGAKTIEKSTDEFVARDERKALYCFFLAVATELQNLMPKVRCGWDYEQVHEFFLEARKNRWIDVVTQEFEPEEGGHINQSTVTFLVKGHPEMNHIGLLKFRAIFK